MIIKSAEREVLLNQEEPHNLIRPISNLVDYQHLIDREGRFWGTSKMEAFNGSLYTVNRDILRIIGMKFGQRVFNISRRQAEEEAFQNMQVNGLVLLAHAPKCPTIEERGFDKILAGPRRLATQMAERFQIGSPRKERESIEGCIGFAAVQSWRLGSLNAVYMGELTVLPDYRSMGIGAEFFWMANLIYKPHLIILRGRSGRAIGALIKSGLVDPKGVYPFCQPFNEDPEMAALLDLAGQKTAHPNDIDSATGITKAVYAEGADRAYKSDPTHEKSYKWDMMMKDMGLESDNGDAMYWAARVQGKVRRVAA